MFDWMTTTAKQQNIWGAVTNNTPAGLQQMSAPVSTVSIFEGFKYPSQPQQVRFDQNFNTNMTLIASSAYFDTRTRVGETIDKRTTGYWTGTRVDIYKSASVKVGGPLDTAFMLPRYENPGNTAPYVFPTSYETYSTTIEVDKKTRKKTQTDKLVSRKEVPQKDLIEMGRPEGQSAKGQVLRKLYQDQWNKRFEEGSWWSKTFRDGISEITG